MMHTALKERIKLLFPFLLPFVRWLKRRKNELSSLPRHIARIVVQKENRKKNNGLIKTVFICQYIPAWSKNKQLYEALKADGRFETMLLCVPNRISANQLRDPENQSNDTYDYFCENGYDDAVNALIGKNKWFDLKAWCPDYVVCNRYDRPMPVPYTSTELSKYVKICFITYSGVALLKRDEASFDKAFMANTFCFFAESEGKKREFIKWNRVLSALKLSNAYCCGIPAVENIFKAKQDICKSWSFSSNSFRAIYAPRWTTDPVWGGSSFLKYKDTFLDISDHYPKVDLLIRPHPLMFDNFVHNGLMTEKEVADFVNQCGRRHNLKLDTEKEYHSTFWNSSVLICDFSSIIIEYFVTEKPIIYLTYDEKIVFTEQMQAMLSGCYIVKDEQELKAVLEDLLADHDPLAARRKEVCRQYLIGESNVKASEQMKQVLLDGYNK